MFNPAVNKATKLTSSTALCRMSLSLPLRGAASLGGSREAGESQRRVTGWRKVHWANQREVGRPNHTPALS